jgi:hypothetical protein
MIDNTKSFKEIGETYNNDKVTHHRYDLIYPLFLEGLRKETFNTLEIGLGDGKYDTGMSSYLFKEYFPNSNHFIMDINFEYKDDFATVIKGDQSKTEDLEKVKKIVENAKLIIDDGSHHPRHQFISFCYLFENLLENGGYYIIEDTECNYWSKNSNIYGYTIGYDNVFDFFKRQIDAVNSEYSNKENSLNISMITFAKNCIIIKKQTLEEIEINNREYRFKHLL